MYYQNDFSGISSPRPRQRVRLAILAIGLALGLLVFGQSPFLQSFAEDQGAQQADKDYCFLRTRVIGYSQVGAQQGGWFVAGGAFESVVGKDRWELLWAGGAGVDKWRNEHYPGWSKPLVSPCPGNEPPDRVLLSVSGPYGSDEKAWAEAISDTVDNIRKKIPSARQIILQPVVGGPEGKTCPVPGKGPGSKVRASWQHNHIASAIKAVVKKYAESDVQVVAGHAPQVRTCDDYSDALGHLKPKAAEAIGRTIGEYYARWDAECAKQGHVRCGKQGKK